MRDVFLELLKFTFFVGVGMLLSYIYGVSYDKTTLVMLGEVTNCEVVDYSLIFDDQIISVDANQIRKMQHGDSVAYEKSFSFVAGENSEGYVVYSVRARYKDCDEVVGDENAVKPGWIVYEGIQNGKVMHEVRSRF